MLQQKIKITKKIEQTKIKTAIKEQPENKTEEIIVPKKKANGIIHNMYIIVTSNNVLFSVITQAGLPKYTYSAGKAGFKGHEKKNPTALNTTGFRLGQKLLTKDITDLKIIFKGLKKGRKDTIHGLFKSGMQIHELKEESPVPHNGCRRKKQRRV